MAEISVSPSDAQFFADTAILMIEGTGKVRVFHFDGRSWRGPSTAVGPTGPNGAFEVPVGSTVTIAQHEAWLWDPVSLTLHSIHDSLSSGLAVPLQRPKEVFIPGSQGGAPRDHGRLRLSEIWMVVERRSWLPQLDSLLTPASLVLFRADSQREDTLHTFLASGYGRKLGGVMVCCASPLVFSPQSHWVLVGNNRIAFSSGQAEHLLLLPLEGGEAADTVFLDIDPGPIRDGDLLRYAVQQARAFQNWSEEEMRLYSRQLARSKHYLRQGFSDRTPTITQVFAANPGEVWLRHFDPGSWEHGLADFWTIVDLDTRSTDLVKIPELGEVHDLKRNGQEVKILSSIFIRPGNIEVRVLTFNIEP